MAQRAISRLEYFKSHYLPRLREKFKPKIVLLFGSFARGEAVDTSDVDVIVVSERFQGVPFPLRAYHVLQELDVRHAIEFFCYTPEEFDRKKKEIGIVQTAISEGVFLVKDQL